MGMPSHASEGLAEVFCLTDPSRYDNPIVFMSEEFNRTTQYGVDYVIGRNCRFLQGPFTNAFSVTRIREKLESGIEHYETFLNYRRDGSPFMNLVMVSKAVFVTDYRGLMEVIPRLHPCMTAEESFGTSLEPRLMCQASPWDAMTWHHLSE
jgi:hypothetical protein